MNPKADTAKRVVLQRIAGELQPVALGRAKFRIGTSTIHVRFCSENQASPTKYKFNINPNTLSADHEVWICGSSNWFYLAPISAMNHMYNHPDSYPDRLHPEITVVSLDTSGHRVTYALGGQTLDFSPYFQATVGG